MKILPQDILPDGTPVIVQCNRGNVVSSRQDRDQFGMPITVHRVRLTQRFVSRQTGYKPCDVTKDVNYSFIETV